MNAGILQKNASAALALTLVCATAMGLARPAEAYEVPPQPLEWSRLSPETFDPSWRFPAQPEGSGPRLEDEMRELLAVRFELEDPEGGETLRSFGDLAAAAAGLVGQRERVRWLDRLAKEDEALFRRWGPAFRLLLLDDVLRSKRWKPSKNQLGDGILQTGAWDLDTVDAAPWRDFGGNSRVEQGALLVRADLASFKAAECDYLAYPNDVAANYVYIRPRANGYFRGKDPKGQDFAVVKIEFKSDIPFPFGSYRCKLDIFNHFDERGEFVTDIYSASDDFYWMAGRDRFLPVETSSGAFVGYIVARQFGFDLDGVPDKDKHRQEALRKALGNLKRRAEAAYEGGGSAYVTGKLPEFRVVGER